MDVKNSWGCDHPRWVSNFDKETIIWWSNPWRRMQTGKNENQIEESIKTQKQRSEHNGTQRNKISWGSQLIGAAGEDHLRQEKRKGFQREKGEWLPVLEISIPMNQHKGTLTKPGKEALSSRTFKVHLYLSAASPQNRLASYTLASCIF